MRKCINCKWKGEQAIEPLLVCPVCGDNTEMLNSNAGKGPLFKEAPKPVKKEEDVIIKVPKSKPSVVERVKDFAEDVLDDGKRNYSNRKRKSRSKKK